MAENIIIDGEDYAIALNNLKEKYGYDEDISTIVKMCNQWEDSFHKMESNYNKIIMKMTKFEAEIQNLKTIRNDDVIDFIKCTINSEI